MSINIDLLFAAGMVYSNWCGRKVLGKTWIPEALKQYPADSNSCLMIVYFDFIPSLARSEIGLPDEDIPGYSCTGENENTLTASG